MSNSTLMLIGLIYLLFPKAGANIAAYNSWHIMTLGKRGIESEYTNFLLICIRIVGALTLISALVPPLFL